MAYIRPQVQVFQDFNTSPVSAINPLPAHISGPNGNLHRYSVAEEKALIDIGNYSASVGLTATWPGQTVGSIIDPTYTGVFIDNAYLKYFEDDIGFGSTISPVAGYTNRIRSNAVSFAANGTAYPASASLYDRGAQVGDHVYLKSVTGSGCIVTTLDTTITGFSGDVLASSIGSLVPASTNQATTSATSSISKIAGPTNCVTATVNGTAYSGLASGNISEQYTITVVKSSVPGCATAVLNIVSASGLDNVYNVTPNGFGVPTPIGTRGLTVTFNYARSSGCSASAVSSGVGAEILAIGQVWQANVQQAFTATTPTLTATSGAGYIGLYNDTYIITVVQGGAYTASPVITVTTANGLDHSGPTTVTGSAVNVPVGANGLQISFAGGTGLRAGDVYTVPVVAAATGPYNQLILQHDLPSAMSLATDLELRLSIITDVELTANRQNTSTTNWTQTSTGVVIAAGATATTPTWTVSGVVTAIPVVGGTVYLQYREWLQALVNTIGSVQTPGEIAAAIGGQIDPDNPLAWGVNRALSQSNGTPVYFTAVADPTQLTDWEAVLAYVTGNTSIYNYVPLTFDANVKAAYAAQANAESGALTQNWKACFFGLQGQSTEAVVSSTTTADGSTVTATLSDNPNVSGTQYTLLTTTNPDALFLTNVSPGDTVRYLYTADSYGNPIWTEFTVATVLSQTSLLLVAGPLAAVSTPQKIEIWHTLTKDQLIQSILAQKEGYNERVCAVWPDVVGSGGVLEPGYFLAATLAGLVSGVSPQQGLTHVEVTGYDDFSRSNGYFNATQLDTLAAGGVWIVVADNAGNAYTRHALTCNMVDLSHQEEMIRRNDDAINYYFYNTFAPYIGRCNASQALITALRYELESAITVLTNVTTSNLGGMLQSGSIRTLQIDPILADHINVVIDVVRPAPLNNLTINLVG